MPLILVTSANPGTASWSEAAEVQKVYYGGDNGGVDQTAGKLYYLDTDSEWKLADATDTTVGGAGILLGIALGTDPAVDGMLIEGLIDAPTYLDVHSVGSPVWMDTAAGEMTTTKPAVGGNCLRILGYCTATADEIYFRPDGVWGTAP